MLRVPGRSKQSLLRHSPVPAQFQMVPVPRVGAGSMDLGREGRLSVEQVTILDSSGAASGRERVSGCRVSTADHGRPKQGLLVTCNYPP